MFCNLIQPLLDAINFRTTKYGRFLSTGPSYSWGPPKGSCFNRINDKYGRKQSEISDFATGTTFWWSQPNTIRLMSNWCCHLANFTAIYNVLDSGRLAPCYENTMSSTKPEVYNVSQCCQTRTEQHTYKIWQRSAMLFLSYVSRQTNWHTHNNTLCPSRGWSNCVRLHKVIFWLQV